MDKGIAFTITSLILPLIILAALLMLVGVGTSKLDNVDFNLDNMGACKNIGSADEAKVLESIQRVYDSCNSDKKCKYTSCEDITLMENINITNADLTNAEMNQFLYNTYPNILCNVGCGSVSPAIRASYKSKIQSDLISICRGSWNDEILQNMCAKMPDAHFTYKAGQKIRILSETIPAVFLGNPEFTTINIEER